MSNSNLFHVTKKDLQLKWSREIVPILTVQQGEEVTFDCLDCSNGQIQPSSTPADILKLNPELGNPIFGPVFIIGAEPGDVLEVEFIRLEPGSWGFSAVIPGFGLLGDEFNTPDLKVYSISKDKNYVVFKEGIHVPLRPFLGTVGVAPGELGEFGTIPPLDTGGNIDCKHLTEGTKLYLPVRVPGASFSCGDGHAAQGDGEVCGTAIEVSMRATLRFKIHKDMPYVTTPHYNTSGSVRRHENVIRGSYAATGIDTDLRAASRKAVRALIDYLIRMRGLSRGEAYMLTSIAADVKIIEAVNMPNFIVAASLSLNIFAD